MWMVRHWNYNLWVLINAADYSITLLEHNLCHDNLCLGIGQSMCSFLSHCKLGTCWKTIIQKGKQSRLAENRLTLPRHEKHCMWVIQVGMLSYWLSVEQFKTIIHWAICSKFWHCTVLGVTKSDVAVTFFLICISSWSHLTYWITIELSCFSST